MYPTSEELRRVYVDPCQYFKCEDGDTRATEISESGWTVYLDHSLDNCSYKSTASEFDIEQRQKKISILADATKRYQNYNYWASSIAGNEEGVFHDF